MPDLQLVFSHGVNPSWSRPQNRDNPNPSPLTVNVDDPVEGLLRMFKSLKLVTSIENCIDEVAACLPTVVEARRLPDLPRDDLAISDVEDTHEVPASALEPREARGLAVCPENSWP